MIKKFCWLKKLKKVKINSDLSDLTQSREACGIDLLAAGDSGDLMNIDMNADDNTVIPSTGNCTAMTDIIETDSNSKIDCESNTLIASTPQ